MEAQSPRGTSDILPQEVEVWQRVEAAVASVMRAYGYREIRTPIFEHTELFQRGVGETTDIVEKQMYTFDDRGGRSLTLRPEGTAPVVRAFLQHNLHKEALPQNVWYVQPMFRYERPQAGRNRQFHQFGAESLGSLDPACDMEMIAIPLEIYRRLGIAGQQVLVNSIGCPVCRPGYKEALRRFFSDRLDRLCKTCQGRYERNPLRILDCKSPSCKQASADAPKTLDYLCDACGAHFESVTSLLQGVGIDFAIDSRLVRGLDYYTKTVFEIVTDALGAQDALAAGGRYDGLAESLGGPAIPAVGFGAGMERAVLMLKAQGHGGRRSHEAEVYIAALGGEARAAAIRMAQELRRAGVATSFDYRDLGASERSLRAQLKAADRAGAKIALIVGDDELSRGAVTIRSMQGGEQTETAVSAFLGETLSRLGGERSSRPVDRGGRDV